MATPPDGLVSALADRYEFVRELGSGGMAIVYLAVDLKHDRQVALKVLRQELAASIGADRFLREIQIAAKLTHPHVLPLYDSGEAGEFLYYVMPYVEGETLRARLQREGPVSPDQVARVAEEVAGALDYAHRNGVVHRDIKPENILLEDGHAVVADFGVARAVSTAGGEQLTHTGLAVGTPLYMSPEQAAGDTELDGRSDIYSLACVVYEMLCGSAPFTGTTPQEILAKRLTQTAPPLSERVGGTPPDLEQALMKALASDPALRFERASEFAEAVAESRHSLRPETQPQSTRKIWISRRGFAIVCTVVAVLVVSLLTVTRLRSRAAVSSLMEELAPAIAARDFDHVYARVREAGLDLGSSSARALMEQVGGTFSLSTEPQGAVISLTRARPVEGFAERAPESIGRSPVDGLALVAGEYLVSAEHPGAEDLAFLMRVTVGAEQRTARTLSSSEQTIGMVFVPDGPSPLDAAIEVVEFAIDKFEVTNTRYARFVAAGGYADPSFWPETLVVDGQPVPWREGVSSFVDRTGLPGPRRWTGGRFPAGKADHPVAGVSWYEASAFAKWAGGELPTMGQWYRAAVGDSLSARPWGNDVFSDRTRANFNLQGTAEVGSYPLGVSVFGCLDMAGNVREWLSDQAPEGMARMAVGGGWQDPAYMFDPSQVGPTPPDFAREALGFRLVRRR